ncbi:MAG: toxin-activating lysine-acyltransferase [Burkholderiales bacterium]
MITNMQQLQEAKAALKKLPILGPVFWLYARDERRKFTFIADQDWLLMPPVVLDQCKLYMKDEMPWVFVTWALVSDDIDARLRSMVPKIAPHEWKSGEHVWLIDIVAPFGQSDEMVKELCMTQFPGRKVSALIPDPQQGNRLVVQEWEPTNATDDSALH